MRCSIIFAVICAVGCGGTVKHEVTVKIEGSGIFAPRTDLTESQQAAFDRDMPEHLNLVTGIIGKAFETVGDDSGHCIRRVSDLQDEYNARLKKDDPNAGKWFSDQLRGKTVAELAAEYRAVHP